MIIFEPDDLAVFVLERRLAHTNGRACAGKIVRDDCFRFGDALRHVVDRWPAVVPAEALVAQLYGQAADEASGFAWDRSAEWFDTVEISGGACTVRRKTVRSHDVPDGGMSITIDISNIRFKPTRLIGEIHDELRFWIDALDEKGWTPTKWKVVGREKKTRVPIRLPVVFKLGSLDTNLGVDMAVALEPA